MELGQQAIREQCQPPEQDEEGGSRHRNRYTHTVAVCTSRS